MKFETEKRIKEYDENVIVLSHDEAEKFAYLLNEMIKSFKIGDYIWSQYDDKFAQVKFTFRAQIEKGRDITPETLTDAYLSFSVNDFTLINNNDVKIDKH